MTDDTLYYWPIPFRGEFVRAAAVAAKTASACETLAQSRIM